MRLIKLILMGALALAGNTAIAAPAATQNSGSGCHRACLVETMAHFQAMVQSKRFKSVPLSPRAELRENAKIIGLNQSVWARVKTVRSAIAFADPATGNIVSRAGVELMDGRPAYISTRLKVLDNRHIADVEIAADTSDRVVPAYVFALDPLFESLVPVEKRTDRIALEAQVRRYFAGLSSHVVVHDDFDETVCNRFHSGMQITNVARNAVETGPARTCITANEGNPPWGPATGQRIPVIDEERGIVIGITLLHYLKIPDQPTMYVTEVFKIIGGKIVKIDNIGLMQKGIDGLGFAH